LVATCNAKSNTARHDPFINEGEIREIASETDFGDTGKISGIKISDLMSAHFSHDTGWAAIYIAPTAYHLRMAITLACQLKWQIPQLRLDYRLLSGDCNALVDSHETLVDVIQELEACAVDNYGAKHQVIFRSWYDNENGSWPPMMRYLDSVYIDNMDFVLKDDMERESGDKGSTTQGQFGIHTIFREHVDPRGSSAGSIIVVAEKDKVEGLLLKGSIVESTESVRNGTIIQLQRLSRSKENPDVQLWVAKRWALAR
jgi:hypothetical protein